jgi:hypothetical protein
MNDETRKLLKVFGVAVTDFEAEAMKLGATAGKLTSQTGKDELLVLLKDTADLCRELSTRWTETTQHVFGIQSRLLAQIAEAAARLQSAEGGTGNPSSTQGDRR